MQQKEKTSINGSKCMENSGQYDDPISYLISIIIC